MQPFSRTHTIFILPSLSRPLETSGQLAEGSFYDSSYTIFYAKTFRVKFFGRERMCDFTTSSVEDSSLSRGG